MPPVVHREALQHAAVLRVEKNAAGSRKVRREIFREHLVARRQRDRPTLAAIGGKVVLLLPAIARKPFPLSFDRFADALHLLRRKIGSIVATGRSALRQLAGFQPHRERLVVERRLAQLAGKDLLDARVSGERLVARVGHNWV
jgi:hypothetical protein